MHRLSSLIGFKAGSAVLLLLETNVLPVALPDSACLAKAPKVLGAGPMCVGSKVAVFSSYAVIRACQIDAAAVKADEVNAVR